MVLSASTVDWTTVSTEVEALQLEYSWIKEFDPRFNVRYRDDKSYPSLAVTLYEDYPRLQVMRGSKRKGVRYFGPYAHAWAIRETLDLLLRVFPARTCSQGVFTRARQIGRPCLLGYIGKCSAPCVGRVTAEEHRQIVLDFCDFMAGSTGKFMRRLQQEMKAAADAQEYERAARLRDDLGALERATEKNAVVLPDGTNADVIGIAEDALEAAVQVFYVRGGRVRGQRGWVVDKVEDVSMGDLVEQFLVQTYGEETDAVVPREVLVPALPPDVEAVDEWLLGLRGAGVDLRVPQRGDKRALLETVTRNATQALALHKTKRASDLTARSRALEEIQQSLDLDTAPLRIECYDISNLQGTDVVASMVVFEDGLARKSEYRRFVIRGLSDGTADDVASIHEVISRRFRRYLEEASESGETAIDPQSGRPRKFAYAPQLVVVDGGQPQVAAAAAALRELGIDDVGLCGLAKRLEEVWLPERDDPVILPRTSEGLYLLQRVRDEAHRFAITFHRERRSRGMTASALDNVPGLGEVRRKALLRHFGSVKKIKAATVDELTEVSGIGRATAEAIRAALADDAGVLARGRTVTSNGTPAPGATAADGDLPFAVNMATGEILGEDRGEA
jgi:excinuclease ABC subunit C